MALASTAIETPDEVQFQNRHQFTAIFSMLLNAQVAELLKMVPPHEIANALMGKAANLMASLNPPDMRQQMVSEMLRSFRSKVDQTAIELRKTPGGIIKPNGGIN